MFSRFCIIAQFYEFETQMLSVEQFPFNAHADRRLVRILAILINPATLFEKFHLNCHQSQAHHLRRKRRSRVVRCHYCQHRQIRLQPKMRTKYLSYSGFHFITFQMGLSVLIAKRGIYEGYDDVFFRIPPASCLPHPLLSLIPFLPLKLFIVLHDYGCLFRRLFIYSNEPHRPVPPIIFRMLLLLLFSSLSFTIAQPPPAYDLRVDHQRGDIVPWAANIRDQYYDTVPVVSGVSLRERVLFSWKLPSDLARGCSCVAFDVEVTSDT